MIEKINQHDIDISASAPQAVDKLIVKIDEIIEVVNRQANQIKALESRQLP